MLGDCLVKDNDIGVKRAEYALQTMYYDYRGESEVIENNEEVSVRM